MSFGQYDDCLVWTCDKCGSVVHYPPGNFWGAFNDLKSMGWRAIRDDDGWLHYCAKCKKSEASSFLDRKPRVVG